jgi:DNA-binding response OmpR family regulator
MKLLIADDDRTFCFLLAAEMRSRGWTVDIASDAMQAVMFAMRGQPEAILLDIQMPGGTGVEALRKLKASTKTASIPVIGCSATADSATEGRIRELGATDFLRKPLDADALDSTLRTLRGT